jgi:exopolysaccharide biosynthesis polyprenyl glycosylphosphotransferase
VLRHQSHRLHTLLVTLDVALSGVLFLLLVSSHELSGIPTGTHWAASPGLLATALMACLAWPLSLQQLGLYDSQRTVGLDETFSRLLGAALISALLVTATAFGFHAPIRARFPLELGAAQFALFAGERFVIFGTLRMARRLGRNTRNVLIVGSGPRAAGVQRLIHRRPEWGLRIVGFVDEGRAPIDHEIPAESVHKLVEMPELLRREVIDEVIIAMPRSMLGSILPVVAACGSAGVPFTLLADIFGDYLPPPVVTRFDTLAALRFAPVHHSPARLLVKRAIDITGSTLGLLVAAPVIGAAGLMVRLTSPGPVFFRQVRCGLYGRQFSMLKLRTMCVDAEEKREALLHLNEMTGPVFKLHDDPRVTPVGRFLRRYSLDELPQLWNVLKGDMSLVGPRPPVPHEVVQYETFERRRLSMRPGITCLWQVSGRNQVCSFDEWVRLDLEYIDTWSLANDLKILLKTFPAVLRGTGAS